MARTPEFGPLAHDIDPVFAEEYRKAPPGLKDADRYQCAFLIAFGGYKPAWLIRDKETNKLRTLMEEEAIEFISAAERISGGVMGRKEMPLDEAIPRLRAWVAALKPLSLNMPMRTGDTAEFGDFLRDPENTADEALSTVLIEDVEAALRKLPPEQAQAIRARFEIGGERFRQFDELAKEQGVVVTTVKYRVKTAIKKLRQDPRNAALKAYLES